MMTIAAEYGDDGDEEDENDGGDGDDDDYCNRVRPQFVSYPVIGWGVPGSKSSQ